MTGHHLSYSTMIDHLHVALLNVASAISVFQLTDLWRLLPQPDNAVQWAASIMVALTIAALNVVKIRQELRKGRKERKEDPAE